jgi:two-component system, sensor histidine kinase and response regulator
MSKRFFICSFILLLRFFVAEAQENPKTDSLLNLLKSNNLADTTRSLVLAELARSYLQNSPEDALKYAKGALEIAQKISFKRGEAKAFSSIGNFYWQVGKYPQAMEYYLMALEIEEKIENKEGIARNLNNLGLVYETQNNLDKALEYYEKSLAIDRQIKNEDAISIGLNNIGNIYNKRKDFAKSLDYHNEGLQSAMKNDNFTMIGVSLNNIGDIYFAVGKYAEAIQFQKQAMDLETHINDQEGIAYSLNALSNIYLRLGKLDSAEYYAMQAIQINQKLGITPQLKDNYESIKEIAFQKKDYLKAYWYANAKLTLMDSLFSKDKKELIVQLERNYELGKKQNEIDMLKNENIIKQQEIDKQSLRQIIWIIFLGVALAFAFGLFFLSKQRSRTNAQLNHFNKQLQKNNKDLQETNATKDKLFSIISHDLRSPFNTLKSTLSLMKMNAFSPQEIEKLSSQLEQNVVNISYTLENLLQWSMLQMKQGQQTHIETLDINDIIQETINFYAEVAKNKEIEISTSLVPDLEVSADKNQIRFILRNLVNNALKFTFAQGKIKISSKLKDKEAIITVADTGVGMTPQQLETLFSPTNRSTQGTQGEKGTGLGLLLCKEFTENNGGKISVTSQLYEGSKFVLVLKVA